MATAAATDHSRAVALFHALSDETRLAIVQRLRAGERCVCDLTDLLDAAQSRLSFHLKVLKDAGLVSDRKEGRWSYYTLEAERLSEASDLLNTLATPTTGRATLQLHTLARASRAEAASGVDRGSSTQKKRATTRGNACCD